MASARLIREGLLDSERVCKLPLEARWLFVTVCLSADDVGLFDAAPFALMRKAELQRDLGDHLLSVLADVDLIRLYSVAGKRYGFIPRFGQRLQMRRIKHPLPPLALVVGDDDAARKIKDLGRRFPKAAETFGTFPPEAEAEAEADKRLGAQAKSRGAPPAPPAPAPAPAAPAPAKAKARKPAARRKPPTVAEWPIPRELRDWARAECSLVDVVAETATFRDHEFAKARSDWPATWRNWMRKEQKRLAELAKRSRPAGAKSFRERDSDLARAEVASWGGGRIAARPAGQETLEMEATHGRIDSDAGD